MLLRHLLAVAATLLVAASSRMAHSRMLLLAAAAQTHKRPAAATVLRRQMRHPRERRHCRMGCCFFALPGPGPGQGQGKAVHTAARTAARTAELLPAEPACSRSAAMLTGSWLRAVQWQAGRRRGKEPRTGAAAALLSALDPRTGQVAARSCPPASAVPATTVAVNEAHLLEDAAAAPAVHSGVAPSSCRRDLLLERPLQRWLRTPLRGQTDRHHQHQRRRAGTPQKAGAMCPPADTPRRHPTRASRPAAAEPVRWLSRHPNEAGPRHQKLAAAPEAASLTAEAAAEGTWTMSATSRQEATHRGGWGAEDTHRMCVRSCKCVKRRAHRRSSRRPGSSCGRGAGLQRVGTCVGESTHFGTL